MKKEKKDLSILVRWYDGSTEFGNRWFTVSGLFFKQDGTRVFAKIELMMLAMVLLCMAALAGIHLLPFWLGAVACVLLAQRIAEYIIVYSRNFILNRGRVFTRFPQGQSRSQWLIIMFFLNVTQTIFIFAVWFRFLSFHFPQAFSEPLSSFTSFYFTVVTFLTLGYGDILPVSNIAKMLVILEGFIVFYTLVIVINGLISLHFTKNGNSSS